MADVINLPPCEDCQAPASSHPTAGCSTHQAPAAHFEQTSAGRLLVVRGSALGTCLWELVAIGQGLEPLPWPGRILRAFREGREGEAAVLGRLEALGWVLDPSWSQRTVEVLCGPGRVVRLHPDAAGTPAVMPTTPHVVEVKRLHNQTWQAFRRHGVAGIGHNYDWQFSAEMLATRFPLAIVAENKGETPDENGKRPPCPDEGQLHIEFVTEPPHSRAEVIRRVRKLADAIDGEDIMVTGRPCDDPSQWPCRFIHLRPQPEKDDGYPVNTDDVGEFERYCRAYDRAKVLEGRAKSMKDNAKVGLLRLAGDEELLFTDQFALTVVGGESTKTDWAAMRADGIDVDRYQTKEPRAQSVRVGRR